MATVEFQGDGQQAGQPVPETQANTAQKGLDADEIKSLVKAAVADAYRGIQSSQAKQEKRIKDFVQQQVTVLRGQEVPVTPELERALISQAKQQFAQSDGDNEQEAAPAQVPQPKPVQPASDPSKRPDEELIEKLRAKYGVEVEDSDPEVEMLETKGSWEDYVATMTAAAIKKAKRTGASSPKPKPVPAAVGSAGIDSVQSLEAAYKAEMLANRGKGMTVGDTIKEKYRKQGLDVDGVSFR